MLWYTIFALCFTFRAYLSLDRLVRLGQSGTEQAFAADTAAVALLEASDVGEGALRAVRGHRPGVRKSCLHFCSACLDFGVVRKSAPMRELWQHLLLGVFACEGCTCSN